MAGFFDLLEQIFFTKLIGEITLYTILSATFKFLFVLLVLNFVYKMIRMISMDIRSSYRVPVVQGGYLKLLNDPHSVGIPIREMYYLTENTTIGRADDNAIVIKLPQLSKHQARIMQHGQQYFIDDLGSTNPTRVNGVPVEQPLELKTRDILSMGGLDFIFVKGAANE